VVLDSILGRWNDILTVLTFFSTVFIGYFQIQYYRGQSASFELDDVTEAEYTDHEKFTRYDLTAHLKNDGRDPVSIPSAGLKISGDELELNTHEGVPRGGLEDHEFKTIRLEANEYDSFELHAHGTPVSTTDPLTGVVWMESSDGRIETEVTFERAP